MRALKWVAQFVIFMLLLPITLGALMLLNEMLKLSGSPHLPF